MPAAAHPAAAGSGEAMTEPGPARAMREAPVETAVETVVETIEALHDEDPACDALVKFSVWYLQDYFELGLLPEVTNEAELDRDPQRYRELARQRLHRLGLKTVGDLKRAGIFSRATLAEHVKQHKE